MMIMILHLGLHLENFDNLFCSELYNSVNKLQYYTLLVRSLSLHQAVLSLMTVLICSMCPLAST